MKGGTNINCDLSELHWAVLEHKKNKEDPSSPRQHIHGPWLCCLKYTNGLLWEHHQEVLYAEETFSQIKVSEQLTAVNSPFKE